MTKKVAVALSGGIDSAVTALLLQQQGYEVIGITGNMLCDSSSSEIIKKAKAVAEKLQIQHFVIDTSQNFKKFIIEYFNDSYKQGLTPNPCIMCNKYIKWGEVFNYAINKLNCDFIATGHYANIIKNNNIYKLYPAQDTNKDQLYFLFLLEQCHLSKTLFPLSQFKKEEIKKIAIEYDLPPKSSKESQDICFIKHPNTTKKYLNSLFNTKDGNFIEFKSGKILGKHNGYWQYTIGQRKGIGIAAPEPLYVVKIDASTNTVYVGYSQELNSSTLNINNINWSYPVDKNITEVLVKIRYNMSHVKANIQILENSAILIFDKEISGITPGQACVLYDVNDGHLLGGAFIN